MKESTKEFIGLAVRFNAVGENLDNAFNECADAIEKYKGLMEKCETEEDRKQLELLRPFVVTMKAMTMAFSESIETTDKEDGYIREAIDEFIKEGMNHESI